MEAYLTNIAIPWRCLAHIWHGRIKPTKHDSFLNYHIYEFIYHIARENTINIGEYINMNMREIARNKLAITYYHLIRDTCEDQGMIFTEEEKRLHFNYRPAGAFQVAGHAQRRRDILEQYYQHS